MLRASSRRAMPVAASTIGDLDSEHREGARRLRRVAEAVERVLSDHDLLRQTVDGIIRDFINHERQQCSWTAPAAERIRRVGCER